MEALLFILIVVLLITAGVVTSVRLYTRGALGRGHFRRIRRVRSLPSGNVVEEEIIEEETPVEEEA
jgi:hypothetical protein